MLKEKNIKEFGEEESVKERAERAALEKLEDIHEGYGSRFSTHSFTRFGPLVPSQKFYPPETTDIKPDVDRLWQVFRYGLISPGLAQRVGIPVSRNNNDPVNTNCVSLSCPPKEKYKCRIGSEFGLAVNLCINYSSDIQVPAKDVFVVIVSGDLKKNVSPRGWEHLRKYRVGQRYFKGIIVLDRQAHDDPYNGIHKHKVDWNEVLPRETVVCVVKIMLGLYQDRPELAIPVYGYSGNLYWPRELSYPEVQDLVRSRNQG